MANFHCFAHYTLWYKLFWFSIFGILYVSCSLIGLSFCRYGYISSMILLKIYSVTLTWVSTSYIPVDQRFGLFKVFKVFHGLCLDNFRLTFSLSMVTIFFSQVFSGWNSSLLLLDGRGRLPLNFLFELQLCFPIFPQFLLSFLILFPCVILELFSSFNSIVCLCFHRFSLEI